MASQSMPQNDGVASKIVETIRVRVPQGQSSCAMSSSCSTRFMIQNHSNFKRSGAPARFMFYQAGSWIDFPSEVFGGLRLGFSEGKPVIDLSIGGAKYLFDFLRMLQIDFVTENQRSIAWIDENGKCFFPKVFVDEEFEEVEENHAIPKVEIEIRVDMGGNSNSNSNNSGKRKRVEFESNSNEDEAEVTSSKKKLRDDEDGAAKRLCLTPSWPNAKPLSQGDREYSVYSNLLIKGLRKIDLENYATVTAIHQCTRTGPLERARSQVFEKQIEMIKAARGTSNGPVFAWYGASAKGVEGILKHGFAVPNNGTGIYLSHVDLPHISALRLEADDNGEKHLILCRVILGNVERVGPQQCHPSSEIFDTGVDDIKNPKWYVVWCTNMNSHILPECVVSFKSSGYLRGHGKYPFSQLFSKMKSSLPASKVQELMALYDIFKAGKVAKDVFIKQLRSVVGDEMLRSTIQEIHTSEWGSS
ncbi:probable inactive poly [ADP-ribose] polymerase SRO3 [Quercus robur]|uniref:probable inactive poly [ADP-ribose] polymerase SRO3 n=1 Tax=Quercus robur TaxID=38942 RepID=UPI002161F0F5|nr:probable inactive poly [ADP-ribose] polymerase SRO3 [Quercus robur]